MKLLLTQSEDVQKVIKCVIQRNGFFAHPGVMVCSILEVFVSTPVDILQPGDMGKSVPFSFLTEYSTSPALVWAQMLALGVGLLAWFSARLLARFSVVILVDELAVVLIWGFCWDVG